MSDLNRRIASAQGWRGIKHVTRDDTSEWYGIPPESHYDVPVPDYEHDLNAAYSLFADGPHTVDITVDASGTGVTVDQRSNFAHREHGPQVLAQMLAEVWLALHEAERAG